MIKKAKKVLKNGEILGIFPEGTTTSPVLKKPKNGAVFLSTVEKVPIVPISIYGAETIWQDIFKGIRPKVYINIGKPFGPFDIKGTKSEKQIVDARNTQVGVGSRAHKKLQENPQGELTESQKPVDPNKKDKRVKDLNDQNPRSVKVRAHTKRSKENMKYYNEEQRAAYKKIDPKDRTAQSKFHDEQDKKYGKSVSTPKKLSAAGQAIKDKLKKSNDIITEMNIMKLDLMKTLK